MDNITKVRLKTPKGRTASSVRWLQRQLNDPYVQKAHALGVRGRAYFKLQYLNDKFHFLRPKATVVDLGCAPGGWLQLEVKATCSTPENPCVVGLDILPTEPVAGAITLQMDFTEDAAPERLKQALQGKKANVVVSDMAPNTTGIAAVDHLKIMGLLEMALDFAEQVLAPKGTFVAKVFQGGAEQELLARLKANFAKVQHVKPPASRQQSPEMYVVAQGFKGGTNAP